MLLAMLASTSGCRSWRAEDREGLFAMSNPLTTNGIRGPLERALQRESNSLEEGEKYSVEGRREVDLARRQFEAGDYASAAKAYRRIAKKYKESSIGEEAQYRLGECHVAMHHYAKAQDAYDQLFEDYPSTRYVEPVTRQLFTIAQTWLEIAEPKTRSTIRTVSAESEVGSVPEPPPSRDPTLKFRILPNFFNKSRPVFDTQGRALAALKSIWLNDPTGPLADDALMMTASYYLKKGTTSTRIATSRFFVKSIPTALTWKTPSCWALTSS
ncbi:MAG: tetratricopeptide repeat protein [Planctomycetaceae bacterium]